MAEAGNIKIVFSAETTQLKQAFSTIKKEISNIEKQFKTFEDVGKTLTKSVTLPLLAFGGAAFAAAAKLSYTADRILDLNQITGLSTKAIQEWQHVARIAGVELETVTNAIKGLVRRLPQLEDEGGQAAEQLSKLGLTFKDIKTIAPDKLVDIIIDRLAAMENILERNAVGSALFGRAWEDIAPVLGLGADAIKEARQEAHDLGLVLSDEALQGANNFRLELEKLKAQLNITFLQFGQAAMPVLQSLMNAIRDILPVIQNLINAFASLPQWLQNSVAIMLVFAALIGPLILGLGALLKSIVAIKSTIVVIISTSKTMLDVLNKLIVAVQGLSYGAKVLSGIIGFLIVDFISGAIQAEKFKQKVNELKDAMNAAASDAERYAAAMQLWKTTKSVEALNKALKILDKYNISSTQVIEKAEELGVSYEEAAILLIRQAEATNEAAQATNKLVSELSSLQKVQSKNLQSFDEVHEISKEQEKTSPFSNLVRDIKDLSRESKSVNLEPLKQSVEDMVKPSLELHTNFSTLSQDFATLNPVIETSLGNFQLVEGQLQLTGFAAMDTGIKFEGLKVNFETTEESASGFGGTLEKGVQPAITNVSANIDSLLLPTMEAVSTAFDTSQIPVIRFSSTLESELQGAIMESAGNIEGELVPAIENIGTTFEIASTIVEGESWNIAQENIDLTTGIVNAWRNTSDILVGNSIIPDMISTIETLFSGMQQNLSGASETISGAVVGAFQTISDTIQNEAKPDIEKATSDMQGFFSNLGLSAKDIQKTVSNAFKRMSDDIAGHLWGLLSGTETIGEAMEGIWGAVGNMFRYVFLQLMGQVIQTSLTGLANWVAGMIGQAAAAVGAFLAQAYAGLVAFFAFLGPGAPIAAAATMAGIGATIVAFGAWAVGAIKGALGLAEGGIVTGPTLTMLGEGGKKEAVIPLERDNVIAASVGEAVYSAILTAVKVQAATTSTTGIESEQKIVLEIDGNTFARLILPKLQAEADRQGLQLLVQEGM